MFLSVRYTNNNGVQMEVGQEIAYSDDQPTFEAKLEVFESTLDMLMKKEINFDILLDGRVIAASLQLADRPMTIFFDKRGLN